MALVVTFLNHKQNYKQTIQFVIELLFKLYKNYVRVHIENELKK